jgi:hypothetical protein
VIGAVLCALPGLGERLLAQAPAAPRAQVLGVRLPAANYAGDLMVRSFKTMDRTTAILP